MNGNYRFPSVQQSHRENFLAYIESPSHYFECISKYLDKHQNVNYFRYHSAGDIVDKEYLKGMIEVAKTHQNVNFLAYTKKFEIVNEYLDKGYKLPKNLKILLSNWDKNFIVDNRHKLPTTFVDFKDKEKNPVLPEVKGKTARICAGSCEECRMCWHLRSGQSIIFNQH